MVGSCVIFSQFFMKKGRLPVSGSCCFACLERAAAGIEICPSPDEGSDLGRRQSDEIFRFLIGTFSIVVSTTKMFVGAVDLDFLQISNNVSC